MDSAPLDAADDHFMLGGRLESELRKRVLPQRGAEDIIIPLDAVKTADARDALSKTIYGKIFDWIVGQVNMMLAPSRDSDFFIGVLDIFGFEIFPKNCALGCVECRVNGMFVHPIYS